MTMRTEFSKKVKVNAALRANGRCEECGRRLLYGEAEYDHIIADALGGQAAIENCSVVCRGCHAAKTKKDVTRIAKSKRNFCHASGIRKPSRFAGARNSKFKKKLNGSVVTR